MPKNQNIWRMRIETLLFVRLHSKYSYRSRTSASVLAACLQYFSSALLHSHTLIHLALAHAVGFWSLQSHRQALLSSCQSSILAKSLWSPHALQSPGRLSALMLWTLPRAFNLRPGRFHLMSDTSTQICAKDWQLWRSACVASLKGSRWSEEDTEPEGYSWQASLFSVCDVFRSGKPEIDGSGTYMHLYSYISRCTLMPLTYHSAFHIKVERITHLDSHKKTIVHQLVTSQVSSCEGFDNVKSVGQVSFSSRTCKEISVPLQP